jgi:hypothetical protein
MAAFKSRLVAINSTGNASVTIDLGYRRPFLAWATVTMIDSLTDFDRDNAVAADIFTVDGVRLPWQISGGDHWGAPGAGSNVYPGAWVGFGQRINIWLRVFHMSDLEAYGEAIVLTLD